MTLQALQDEMLDEVQRLSYLFEQGTLSHEEWEATLAMIDGKIAELPEDQRGGIDTEMFYPIEPEDL